MDRRANSGCVRCQPSGRWFAVKADLGPKLALIGHRRFEFGYRRAECRVIA
jgi:hypothetical protein